jgi:hypothetical protein
MSSFMIPATKQPEFQMVSKKAKINKAHTVCGEKSHLVNKNNNGHKEDSNELTSLQVKIVSERFHEHWAPNSTLYPFLELEVGSVLLSHNFRNLTL